MRRIYRPAAAGCPLGAVRLREIKVRTRHADDIPAHKELVMHDPQATTRTHPAPATREDILRVLGEMDDAEIVEILAFRPTVSDLEAALLRTRGDDAAGSGILPGSPVINRIVEILAADEEAEEADSARR
jgi:hypothetical protein